LDEEEAGTALDEVRGGGTALDFDAAFGVDVDQGQDVGV
jgi:hypothetical protein